MNTIYRHSLKRIFDLLAASLLLLVATPVMVVVWATVRVFLGRPVLYRQVRPGLSGEPFIIYKFRTMLDVHDRNGDLLPDTERTTPVGQRLRSFSLDELPELFNVLKGEMSLVGPRPLLMQYLPRYSPEQSRRHDVRPGITGWAQINGRNALPWDERLAMDVWYVDHQSFRLDLRILFTTFFNVIRRKDISQEGYFSSPEFFGTPSGTAPPEPHLPCGSSSGVSITRHP
jgi:sugar transferase EpsL